jgi:hypothetical protein
MDAVLAPQDQLIVIAEDDSRIRLAKKPAVIDAGVITGGDSRHVLPERTLVLGWNWRAPKVISELDNYVAPGSSVLVVSCCEEAEKEAENMHLANQQLECRTADTTDRAVLDGLAVAGFDHIVLLCYSDRMDIQQADARTLITLLHLRDISEKLGRPLSIVSEMLDIRNRDLAQVAKVNDFIISDNLISLLLTQISENKHLAAVFADMFDPEGAEVYLKPAARYVRPGVAVNFATVVEAARRLGESAIGYKIAAQASDSGAAFGVVVNPAKSSIVVFAEADRVIVAADD